jgi:hypothetical protein
MTDLTTDIVREFLDYNPETGIFTWRTRGREWFTSDRICNSCNTRFAGKAAGCVATKSTGYPRLKIKLLGKLYIASRLAFLAMGESLPEQVDHANGNSLDNRWANLQASTPAENMKNQSMRRTNTSGITGVYWNKVTGKWLAQVMLCGKRKSLGYFDDLDIAAMEVMEFRAANGFTARHGQELSAYQQARP